jgi:hypothetical protein
VPEFCTCGAQLPEDARFCHKCGKPQREEAALEEVLEPEVAVQPEIVAPEPVLLPINLRNKAAVRAALLAGLAVFFVSIPLGALAFLSMAIGGGFAVYLYRRGTGQTLSVANGARLGWITGIFVFLLILLNFTLAVALQPNYFEELRQEITKRSIMPEAQVRQIVDLVFTPVGIGAMLIGMFLLSTLPPALGGAVGAKLFHRR